MRAAGGSGGEKGGVCSRSFSPHLSCCVLPPQTVPAGSDSQGLLVGGLVRVLGSKPQRAVRFGVPKREKWRGPREFQLVVSGSSREIPSHVSGVAVLRLAWNYP